MLRNRPKRNGVQASMEAFMAPKPQSNHRKKSPRGSKTIINVDYFRKYLYFIFGSLLNRHLRVETQFT